MAKKDWKLIHELVGNLDGQFYMTRDGSTMLVVSETGIIRIQNVKGFFDDRNETDLHKIADAARLLKF